MGHSSSSQNSQSSSTGSSSSYNQAYPQIQSSFGGQTAYTGTANNAIASLLGLNGSTAGTDAFNQFKNSSGYDFINNEGLRTINANNASRGLLSSGSALRGISQFGTNLANSYLNNYLSSLSGLSQSGLAAGGLLTGAGQTSSSNSNSQSTGSGSSSGFSLK